MKILKRDRDNIQRQLDLLSSGNFSKDAVALLLINIRDHIEENSSHLKEIAHFVAHSKRDRYYTFEETEKRVKRMLKKFKSGGSWKNDPIFIKEKVFAELVSFLESNDFNIELIRLNEATFFNALYDFLEGVEIDIPHKKVDRIIFSRYKDKANNEYIGFLIKFNRDISGVVNLKKNVELGLPLFD